MKMGGSGAASNWGRGRAKIGVEPISFPEKGSHFDAIPSCV